MGRRKDMSKVEDIVKEAIDNVRSDRTVTKELLNDLINYMSKSPEPHERLGPIAAKYVETQQRSNEQLVKAAQLLYKQQSGTTGLSDEDKSEIYDMLGSSPETAAESEDKN